MPIESQKVRTAPATMSRQGLFISWARLRRADTIAERLGIESITVRHFRRGLPALLAVGKYLVQFWHTFFLLARRRPPVVFVTNPPFVAVLSVYLYALLFRARFVIDFHSGCFLDAHWRRWLRVQRFLARRASLNLVHNEDNAREVEPWGVPFRVFPSLPPDLETCEAASGEVPVRPLAVYICSFKPDEPVDAFLAAAREIPDAEFLVTGRAPEGLRDTFPPNVRLTGFLDEEEYNRTLSGASLIIALTTRPGTLLYGAQEAIALRKPLVLSRTPTLEKFFTGGTVFGENSPEGLQAAIREALARREELAGAMEEFAARYRAEGDARVRELKELSGV